MPQVTGRLALSSATPVVNGAESRRRRASKPWEPALDEAQTYAHGHMPGHPKWRCTGCDEPWPCPTKRARLLEQYADTPTSLRVLMAMRLADAASDLGSMLAEELYGRFMGWVPGAQPIKLPAIFRPYVGETRWPTNGSMR